MRTYALLASIGLHLLFLIFALHFSFEEPLQTVSLGFGNVEFTTFSKNVKRKTTSQKNNRKSETQNEGEGEALESEEKQDSSLIAENSAYRANSGKFSIDFLGKRVRAIYSYTLPDYPSGVEKEADIVLKIIIAPDGTISRVFPLIKADSKLEIAAINAVKNWRFEALPKEMPQIEQEAVVVFPYRLR